MDYVNEQFNMRTRGTVTYSKMENASDFEYALQNNPKIVEWIKNHSNYTMLCEITTPNLKIVIDYGNTPQFWLVGVINKDNYSLMSQSELDELGKELNVQRPESYTFLTIQECLDIVKTWEGKEGICLYSNDGQTIHKIKAELYLKLHRFKSDASLDNTVELFVEYGCPSYNDFLNNLTNQYDFECMEMIRPFASIVLDAWKETEKIIAHMKSFVIPLKGALRKDAALAIIGAYGKTNRSSFVFSILDHGELTSDQVKKLVFQSLKK